MYRKQLSIGTQFSCHVERGQFLIWVIFCNMNQRELTSFIYITVHLGKHIIINII